MSFYTQVKSETNELTGRLQFFLNSTHEKFDTVGEFIQFYHSRQDLPQSAFFKYPIPNREHFIHKLWYKGDMDRTRAEILLLTQPVTAGKFLIRDRIVNNNKVGYTASFVIPRDFNDLTKGHEVKHQTALEVGSRLKTPNENVSFWSLNHMVQHYSANPIFISDAGAVKLTKICNDGIHTVSDRANNDGLIIELNEPFPYVDPANELKMRLLTGFKLHNAVRCNGEEGNDFYTADFGTRKGLDQILSALSILEIYSRQEKLMVSK